jgi:rhodanese-related sulfurtransferase
MSSPRVHLLFTRRVLLPNGIIVQRFAVVWKESRMFRSTANSGMAAAVLVVMGLSVSIRAQGPAVTPTEDRTPEVSTEELHVILANRSATVLDARPYLEFAVSHIPGAVNVAPKPGVPMSMYVSDVAEIRRLLNGNKGAPLVLYCNGLHCGKSRRLAAELLDAGYSNVRRYQLGIPMWRAMGGVCEVELEGIRHILANDGTAVVIDAREPAELQKGSLRGARNIPRSLVLEGKDVGEVKRAKDDGRLPMEDHNTRILVLASDAAAARYVAEALTREAFHNVSYVAGPFATVHRSLSP